MWRKYFKKIVYVSIIVVPFLILFFHPKNFKTDILLDPVIKPVSWLQAPVLELKKLFYFQETYDNYLRLRRQNSLLKAQVIAMQEAGLAGERYKQIQAFRRRQDYSSVVANVIGRDPSDWNASLIIDKGLDEGTRVGQPVVSPLGVVGKVLETGEHTSKVILLSDPSFAVAAIVQRSRESGLLTGSLEGICHLQYLTEKSDVRVGDEVVTSKLSTAFPAGILIGRISDVRASVNSHSVECLVDPAVDLSELEEVVVVEK